MQNGDDLKSSGVVITLRITWYPNHVMSVQHTLPDSRRVGLSLVKARDNVMFRPNRQNVKYQSYSILVPVLLLCPTASASAVVLLLKESKYQLNSVVERT